MAEAKLYLHHKRGHRVPVRVRAVPIRNADGSIIGVAETMEESPAVVESNRRRSKLARYGALDETTGVLNHGFLHAYLREKLVTAQELGIPVSVIVAEVDCLKHLRMSFGIHMLTSLLRATGQSIGNFLRPNDILGRWNGDRFLAILAECGGSEVERVAERLKKSAGVAEIEWWGDRIKISISMGCAGAQAGDTPESLVERAELALAENLARRDGRAMACPEK